MEGFGARFGRPGTRFSRLRSDFCRYVHAFWGCVFGVFAALATCRGCHKCRRRQERPDSKFRPLRARQPKVGGRWCSPRGGSIRRPTEGGAKRAGQKKLSMLHSAMLRIYAQNSGSESKPCSYNPSFVLPRSLPYTGAPAQNLVISTLLAHFSRFFSNPKRASNLTSKK